MKNSLEFEIEILRSRSRTYMDPELQPYMSEEELIQQFFFQKLR